MMNVVIRAALPADLITTETIESEADTLLVEHFKASDWPLPTSAAERAAMSGYVLVAEDIDTSAVIGFVHVLELDGHVHLEQLSVLPAHARRGHGRRLVQAALHEAKRRGYDRVTLRTFADVPWNAPFYASCGFTESEPDSPLLRRLVETEEALGLFSYGPRLQMTAEL